MYSRLEEQLRARPRTWLVSGAAGFIGSNLVEALLKLDQTVTGLDNFSTGHRGNLSDVRDAVGERRWRRFRFIEGDIRSLETCVEACRAVELVLHQAALGSVPRSLEDPVGTHASNVSGFLNLLLAARNAGAGRFVYASSSAIYGDDPAEVKVESAAARSLTPYALSKQVDELYAEVFTRCYGLSTIGLRYFNIFGPRQDPEGAYASVIPAWIARMIRGEAVQINGDGETTRDFCFVADVVQANLLAATAADPEALNQVYNIAVGEKTSLNQLFDTLRTLLAPQFPWLASLRPVYGEFRRGDVRFSLADISKARSLLGYQPNWHPAQGLAEAIDWYVAKLSPQRAAEAA
jgi:UDP-N-acetylglucosamine 4-epimerase